MHKITIGVIALHKKVSPGCRTEITLHVEQGWAQEGKMFKNWMRVTRDAVLLGLDTQSVIGLRLMKLSRGGRAAEVEARRMVTEKTSALAEAGLILARCGPAGKVIKHYRTHVSANKRRLLKS